MHVYSDSLAIKLRQMETHSISGRSGESATMSTSTEGSAHILDSAIYRDQFGTAGMRRIFSDRSLVQIWMDVESALARAEAAEGLIPADAAGKITAAADASRIDLLEIKRLTDEMDHPFYPFVKTFASIVPDGAGEYVHWGATTQDIMDTACVIQLRMALEVVEELMRGVKTELIRLAKVHRMTMMPGRTHGQHALPITFGFKIALILDEFMRHEARLQELRPRLLVAQLSGAVGTLASMGGKGFAVQRAIASDLGLGLPRIAWHSARDRIVEFVCVAAMIGVTCAKVAMEVIQLQRTEIGELEEPSRHESVGSSTMPQKRNPMVCEAIVAVGRVLKQQPALALDSAMQQHERDMSAWQAEWEFVPETAILLSAGLGQTQKVLAGLVVNEAAMARNVKLTDGLINAEAVMLALGAHVGRQRAHDLVTEAGRRSLATGRRFRDCLVEDDIIRSAITIDALDTLLDPASYLGEAAAFVDRVIDDARQTVLEEATAKTGPVRKTP